MTRLLLPCALLLAPLASAATEQLAISRLDASPSLSGPTARSVKISPDGTRVSFLQGKESDKDRLDLWEYHIADGVKRMLVDSATLEGEPVKLDEVELARRERARIDATGIVEYDWSEDGKALLFPLGGDLHYRGEDGAIRRLTRTAATETDAKISPGGGYVSFVREQNLFVIELATGRERAITTDGGGAISCGMAEFVAQEEMYRSTGYWWSKDDRRIAWTRVDESGVKQVDRYEIGADGVTTIAQRYPFAGTANAMVQLFVTDLASTKVREVELGEHKEGYLARVEFSPDGTLAVQTQSRDQTTLDLVFLSPDDYRRTRVLRETQPHGINLHSDLHFVDGGARFLWTSERNGFNHIYLYRKNGALERQLTDGSWSVAPASRAGGGVRAVDTGGHAWFLAWTQTPTEQDLYRVSLAGGAPERMTAGGGWFGAEVPEDGSFFVEKGQGPLRPPYTAIRAASGKLLAWITENPLDPTHPYFPYLEGHRPAEFGTLPASDGAQLQYRITLPAGFDPERSYPAVVYLYGGPGVGGGEVRKNWPIDADFDGLNQVLARSGYVVFTLDNRGTAYRGRAFEDPIRGNMGHPEVEDQLLGLQWLKSRPFVDADRIGVYGWSYGGYLTLMLLTRSPGSYTAGISGAPVTNWRLYDTHYTERYMGDPDDGEGRYERSSPITYAGELRDPLLIVHGMADDNVFFDNTVQMIDALQKAGKPFEMMTYPGKRHHVSGTAEKVHLLSLFKDFFDRQLRGPDGAK